MAAGRQSLLNQSKRNSIDKLIDELAIKGIDVSGMHPDRAIGIYTELCASIMVID